MRMSEEDLLADTVEEEPDDALQLAMEVEGAHLFNEDQFETEMNADPDAPDGETDGQTLPAVKTDPDADSTPAAHTPDPGGAAGGPPRAPGDPAGPGPRPPW